MHKRSRLIPELAPMLLLIAAGTSLLFAISAAAATIDELKQRIGERGTEIEKLEREIAQYEREIGTLEDNARTLSNSIRTLDLTNKKLNATITLTEKKISSETLKIEKLSAEIREKEGKIDQNYQAVEEILREIDRTESKTFVEVMLSNQDFGQFWDEIEGLLRLNAAVRDRLIQLAELKAAREADRSETERERATLVQLKRDLSDQRELVAINRREKNKLLASTKNTEANYRKLLKEKIALKEAFEEELRSFEAELRFALDPSSLPAAGSGVLSWPVNPARITQKFGNTAFALAGAYSGKGHNGIDLAAAIGTPIRAAASGTVVGAGDTDAVCPGASYGKWVLVRHRNGLATLYAHLSVIRATEGQEVAQDEVLGYSGNSGYSTGPHLHFTVYAADAVKVLSRQSRVCGGRTYTMPIAPLHTYLDPLQYLTNL